MITAKQQLVVTKGQSVMLQNLQDFFMVCVKKKHDVIKWKHFLRYWPFVREIHQWLVDSPHKGQLHRALMFWSATEQTVEQTIETPVIWNAIALIMTSQQYNSIE